MTEQALGVIPGPVRLGNARHALGREGRQQQGRLHLGAGHRRDIGNAVQAAAGDGQRGQFPALAARDHGPHLPKGSDHTPHRPAPNRLIPGQHGEEVLAGQQAGEQADAGSGVPAVERVLRFRQTPEAFAGDPEVVRLFSDPDAHRPERPHRVQTVLAAAISRDEALPLGQRAQDDRPMRNGLISRDRQSPCQGAAWVDGQ